MAKTPAIFVGHGSPMNAIEENIYSETWARLAASFAAPKAALVISAHWFVEGSFVTSNSPQKTIHDFYGFPPELFAVKYEPEGDLELAKKICQLIPQVKLDGSWGLDHGTWSVLRHFYPAANIPTIQLSIDQRLTAQQHFELAKNLRQLRDENVLIIGSGNIVHNLRMLNWQGGTAYDWAQEFSAEIKKLLLTKDYEVIINYKNLRGANLAVPTPEHFLPLLYILALLDEKEEISIFADEIVLGSIGMMGIISS